MTTEYESNCAYCYGRDTHCFEYITESADGLIHVGEPCLISKLRTQLDLKRECKRLRIELDKLSEIYGPEECYNRHSKIGKLIPRGSSPLDTYILVENSGEEVW